MAQGIIRENIVKAFGRGSTLSSIISSASLVVLCLFYIYSAATYAHLIVYPLIDRVTYYTVFGVYITNEYVDHVILGSLLVIWLAASLQKSNKTVYYVAVGIPAAFLVATAVANNALLLQGVALASLPAIVALLLYNRYSSQKILRILQRDLTLNYFGLLGIVLGVVGLVFAIASIVSPNAFAPAQVIRNYAHDISLILSSFSPILLLLLITCLPVKLFAEFGLKRLKIKPHLGNIPALALSGRKKTIYLSLVILLSMIIAVIPHLSTVNSDGQQVGVDTGYYVNWVRSLANSTGPSDLLYQAFVVQDEGHRPLSLLFIFSIYEVTQLDLPILVEFLPLILGPALILVVFLLTKELTSNDLIAITSAFVTTVSFQVLIGIYAGFYSNWVALIIGYLSLVFMFRFLKQGMVLDLTVYGILALLTLFAHIYTWSVLSIVGGTFLLVAMVIRPNTRIAYTHKNIVLLLLILGSTVAIDVTRSSITGSSGGVERDLELADSLVGLEQFSLRWNNLTYATTAFVGGLFANFLILGLGLYWLFRTHVRDHLTIFILIFFSIGVLPFLFGEWIIQTRVFYNIPFQIPVAIVLFRLKNQMNGSIKVASLYLWLILAAILAVSNFYLVVPQS